MATKIKLTRMGMKKQPTYRVVIQPEHSKRDGRYIENIGYYDPRTEPATIEIKKDRVEYWLSVGAQPTESVGRLLKSAGITDKYYRARFKKKTAPEASTQPAPAAAAPAPSVPAAPLADVVEPAGEPAPES